MGCKVTDISGKVLTVKGQMESAQLGMTLMHEHILFDHRRLWAPNDMTPTTEKALWDQNLSLDNLHIARQYPRRIADNCIMADAGVAISEVSDYRNWGGNSIVDASHITLGRNPLALRRISNATHVNIIMGTGFYIRSMPPEIYDWSIQQLEEAMVMDITIGIGQTSIGAGIIGEVGIEENPITDTEIRIIKTTARASRTTGAPISFHRGGKSFRS